ncbi:MAG: hypothetical protein ACOYOK_05200 [Pseudobdellovibrionaceae bacterium]
MRLILRQFLVIYLSLALIVPQNIFAQMGAARGPTSTDENAFPQPAVDPKVDAFLDRMQNGQQLDNSGDAFHLLNQSIEILNEKNPSQSIVYDLNQLSNNIPFVPVTDMTIKYSSQTQELIFEGTRGADAQGQNGKVVVRQILKNIDLIASAQDKELFQFVDSRGAVHVIDLGFIASDAFRQPIPVIQNLWLPEKPYSTPPRLKVGFLTPGTVPFHIDSTDVVARNPEGQAQLENGDFYILDLDTQKPVILSRHVTYHQMIRGFEVLELMGHLLSPHVQTQLTVEKILTQLQGEYDKQDLAIESEKISPQAKILLSYLPAKTLKVLQTRRGELSQVKNQSRGSIQSESWTKTYAEILQNSPDVSEQDREVEWFKYLTKISGINPTTEKINSNLKNQNSADSEVSETTSQSRAKLSDKIKIIRQKLFTLKTTGILAGTAGTVLFQDAYQNFEVLQQIKVIAFAYENFYPEVLKDAVYRQPLLLSMASLAAMWPAAVATSAMTGNILKSMAEKLKNETSKKALIIKDLARNWGVSLNNWQRINSFGMRLYAKLILPYWRVAIEDILKQKSFFNAINSGLNPLQKVLADSEMGRKLGLTEDQRLGLNRLVLKLPGSQGELLPYTASKESVQQKQTLQSLVSEENYKKSSLAMLIAAIVVAEKNQLDPATVIMLQKSVEQGLDVSKVLLNLEKSEYQEEWKMLADTLIQQLSAMKMGSFPADGNIADLVQVYKDKADTALNKLRTMPDWQKRWIKFKRSFSAKVRNSTISAANFGVEDSERLKKIFTNEFVSDQVKKEFVVDHLMVVGIVGLYGDRAKLDAPEHLSADANGLLWTSKAHWFDIFMNTYIHFFVSGSTMALIFQKIKPQVNNNYKSEIEYRVQPTDRTEPFFKALKNWTVDVMNPLKADLGGILLKRLAKRFTTITAGLTMMMVLRVGVWDQPIAMATKAFLFNFIAAQWFYAWVWTPVQSGNQLMGDRIEAMRKEFYEATTSLDKNYSEGMQKFRNLYQKYNPKSLAEFSGMDGKSKEDIFQFVVKHPPIYTTEKGIISWLSTWTAAVTTTIMAVPLSIILMDEKQLSSPDLFAKWALISAGLYAGSYALLGKKPWQYYIKKYQEVREKYLSFKSVDLKSTPVLGLGLNKSTASVISCDQIF